MFYGLLVTVFILICALQIIAVLLQASKGTGLAGSFGGGGGMGAMFGSRGAATFLSKVTAVLATLFMVLALGLAMITSRRGVEAKSLVEEERQSRGASSSPAAILPSVPATQGTQPQPAPPTTDSGK